MPSNNLYLAHHGIKGQRWGVRRYQNPDGTLTEEGKKKAKYYKEFKESVHEDLKKDALLRSNPDLPWDADAEQKYIDQNSELFNKSVRQWSDIAKEFIDKYGYEEYDLMVKRVDKSIDKLGYNYAYENGKLVKRRPR